MEEHKDHLQEHDEEQDEALSLCDLPLNDDEQKEDSGTAIHNRRPSSSSEPPEFFEFFNNLTAEMSSAEDIIFHGKLVPFKDLSPPQTQSQNPHSSDQNQDKRHSIFRRRSESLSGLQYSSVSRSNSINNTKLMMRSSRSLDYRRLERFSSSKTTSSESESSIDRNSSSRSIGRCESKRTVKPRWYVLMFGVVKPPAEMELSDIKSRQFRRNISSTVSKKPPPVNKSSSYKLLKVLSCRDNTSVAVTTPFCIPPPA